MEKWEINVTLTFPVTPADIAESHRGKGGDSEVDFSVRALRRVRGYLDALIRTSLFDHYTIRPQTGGNDPNSDFGRIQWAKRVLD